MNKIKFKFTPVYFFLNQSMLLKFRLHYSDVIFVFEINNRVYPSMAC